MSITSERSLAIYFEHPDWFRPLFEELDRRGTPYVELDATTLSYDAGETEAPYSLVFNRMSPSAYLREAGSAIHFTSQYLAHLQRLGVRVINGWQAWQTEISKAYQLSLLERLGPPPIRWTGERLCFSLSSKADGVRSFRSARGAGE